MKRNWHWQQQRCGVCGRRKKGVAQNRKMGQLICRACYMQARNHDKSTHEPCSLCEEVKSVATRTKDGKSICPMCYQRQRRI